MAYATPADMAEYFEPDALADLASDTGDPVADIANSPVLLRLLSAASGKVNSAATVANMYQPADLAALTGDDLEMLKAIVCGLAMQMACGRRPGRNYAETYKLQIDESNDTLDRIRKGERVFAVQANRDAGNMAIEATSLATYQNLNLIPDRVRNYYPSRASRLPLGRLY